MKQLELLSSYIKLTKSEGNIYKLEDMNTNFTYNSENNKYKKSIILIQELKRENSCIDSIELLTFFKYMQEIIFKLKQIYSIYAQYDSIKKCQFTRLLEVDINTIQNNFSQINCTMKSEEQVQKEYESSQVIEAMIEKGQVEEINDQQKQTQDDEDEVGDKELNQYFEEELNDDQSNYNYRGLKRKYVDLLIKEYEEFLIKGMTQYSISIQLKNPTHIRFDFLKQIDENQLTLNITVKQQSSNADYELKGEVYKNIIKLIDIQGILHLNVDRLIVEIKSDSYQKLCCMYELYEGDREYLSPAIVYLSKFRAKYLYISYQNDVYPFQYRKHNFQVYLENGNSTLRCNFKFQINNFYQVEDVLENKLINFVNQNDEILNIKIIPSIVELYDTCIFILSKSCLEEIEMDELLREDTTLLQIVAYKILQIQEILSNNLKLLIVDLIIV